MIEYKGWAIHALRIVHAETGKVLHSPETCMEDQCRIPREAAEKAERERPREPWEIAMAAIQARQHLIQEQLRRDERGPPPRDLQLEGHTCPDSPCRLCLW